MKSLLKKCSAVFLSLALVASLSPISGGIVLADETEAGAPAATEETEPEKPKVKETTKETKAPKETTTPKETEAPKETVAPKETEAAKETEAPSEPEAPKETIAPEETEAPQETEAPAETEAPKESEVPEETEAPKETEAPEETEATKETEAPTETETPEETETPKETEVPEETETPKETEEGEKTVTPEVPEESVTHERKKTNSELNGKITNGILTWDEVSNGEEYCIYINNATWGEGDYFASGEVFRYNVDEAIDNLISIGEIDKTSPYSIQIIAYGYFGDADEDIQEVAEWNYSYNYTSSVNPKFGNITAKINGGILEFKKYNRASDYKLFISDYTSMYLDYGKGRYNLNKNIDWLIKAGYIENSESYRIRLVAYNMDGDAIATWKDNYTYHSDAAPVTIGTVSINGVTNGILNWEPVPDADWYTVAVLDSDGCYSEWASPTSARSDINQIISEMINECFLGHQEQYSIQIKAFLSNNYYGESIELATATYDYTFQKANNPLKVSGKTAKVKYKKLRRKKQTLAVSKVINGLGSARGKKTFVKKSGNKKIKINKYTGKITIKKGLRKKTYKVKINVKAAGNYGYNPSSTKTVTIKIKVK